VLASDVKLETRERDKIHSTDYPPDRQLGCQDSSSKYVLGLCVGNHKSVKIYGAPAAAASIANTPEGDGPAADRKKREAHERMLHGAQTEVGAVHTSGLVKQP
jgi:hypothetical protein